MIDTGVYDSVMPPSHTPLKYTTAYYSSCTWAGFLQIELN